MSTGDEITTEAVLRVAGLARLEIPEHALDETRAQFAAILRWFAALDRLDLDDVAPMAHPLELTNRLAEDTIGNALSTDAALTNAPAREDDFISVPRVIGGGDA